MTKQEKATNTVEVPGLWDDGNAFLVLSKCKRAARKAKWSDEQWSEFEKVARGGDYDHLIQTVMKHFEEEVSE